MDMKNQLKVIIEEIKSERDKEIVVLATNCFKKFYDLYFKNVEPSYINGAQHVMELFMIELDKGNVIHDELEVMYKNQWNNEMIEFLKEEMRACEEMMENGLRTSNYYKYHYFEGKKVQCQVMLTYLSKGDGKK